MKLQADPPQPTVLGDRAMELYGPKLEKGDIPTWKMLTKPQEKPSANWHQPLPASDLAHASASSPKAATGAACAALYAPSTPAAILPFVGSQGKDSTLGCTDMYAPSLQALRLPENDRCEFGGVIEAAYWDDGIGPVGARGRHFGRLRRAMYTGDNDAISILYNFTPSVDDEPPRELSKVLLPAYRIETPDLLLIEAVKLVPRAPYRIAPFDILQISASGTIPDQPIAGYFLVEAEGFVTLGPAYRPIPVVGLTVDEAAAEITRVLKQTLARPSVNITLAQVAGVQQVSNLYPVQPDGTVNLHGYGQVSVTGKTITEARVAIEKHLSQYFDSPDITVDIMGYNSKFYYIVIAGADTGESIFRFPVTGNDTVLDAISNINGLPQVSSKTMWVARPGPGELTQQDILPVNYTAIARGGKTETNYQLMPGDRVYIVDDKLVATGTVFGKVADPIERMLKISQLGSSTIVNYQTMGRGFNSDRFGL